MPRFRRSIYVFMLAFASTLAIVCSTPSVATTIQDEIKIGDKAAKEIEKQVPVSDNKEWQTEVDHLGRILVPFVKRKEMPYTFKVLKEKVSGENQIDAFSLPGGHVYMSERLWVLLTRDERLGVLGHEMSHVDKRHAIDTINESQKRSIWAMLVLVVTKAPSNLWNAADITNTLFTLKYSRKREREADLNAVELTRAAGETPVGLITSLQKILRLEKDSGQERPIKLLSTHPNTKYRVDYLTQRCRDLGCRVDDLTPKFKDEPDRLGDTVERVQQKKDQIVNVNTTKPLTVGQNVWIKKPLWDDATKTVKPTPIAKGVVKVVGVNGAKTAISVKPESVFEFVDIEPGDGVYPRPPDPVAGPPAPTVQVSEEPPAKPAAENK